MVVPEAIARGLPIVATTGGALAETLPQDAGLASPPGDTATLQKNIRQILENKNLYARLSENAEAARAKLRSWDDAARAFAAVLLVPLAAVTRVGGQFFVFVAEAAEGGSLVAKMRPVTLGAVVGNSYVVDGGVKEGERLITGGIQKIGDGAPVSAMPDPGAAGRQGGEGR
jgi:hypothetical protein